MKIGKPLRFKLDDKERKAVDVLKDKLIFPPILDLPRLNSKYTINTNACDTQMGRVLLQEQEEKLLKPTGYWSRSLCDAEPRYDITHKECLTVVWAVFLLRLYLEGSHFIIKTDHQALGWILSLKESPWGLARWRLRLMELDFEVDHRADHYPQAADAMSCLPKIVLEALEKKTTFWRTVFSDRKQTR